MCIYTYIYTHCIHTYCLQSTLKPETPKLTAPTAALHEHRSRIPDPCKEIISHFFTASALDSAGPLKCGHLKRFELLLLSICSKFVRNHEAISHQVRWNVNRGQSRFELLKVNKLKLVIWHRVLKRHVCLPGLFSALVRAQRESSQKGNVG